MPNELTADQKDMLRRIAPRDGQSEWVRFSTRRCTGYRQTQTRQQLKKLGLIERHPLGTRGVWKLTELGKLAWLASMDRNWDRNAL